LVIKSKRFGAQVVQICKVYNNHLVKVYDEITALDNLFYVYSNVKEAKGLEV